MKKLISLVIPLMILSSCQASETKKVEHNYHEIRDDLIDWVEVFNQPEHDYLVYFYSERCGHCASIKSEVISYYLKNIKRMYFVCTDYDAIYGPQADLRGINNIDDFYIFGTPFLVELFEHTVIEYYAGTNAILNYINQ